MHPPPLDLNDLFLFSQVVQRQGFNAAARALGLPKARVSRRIKLLEQQLACCLLQRNSRRVSLTDAGAALYAHCVAMLEEARAGEQAVRQRQQFPCGRVRMSVPLAIADVLLCKLLPRFMQQQPRVRLVLQADNRRIDLLEEGVDVVLRGVDDGPPSPELVQLPLCQVRWGMLAAPGLVLANCTGPEQLEGGNVLLFTPQDECADMLQLQHETGARLAVAVSVLLRSNHIPTLKQAALAGLGVAVLPLYACEQELASGTLQLVLPQWRPRDGRLLMLYPSRRGLSPAVRVLIDFIKAGLPPLLEACRETMPDDGRRES